MPKRLLPVRSLLPQHKRRRVSHPRIASGVWTLIEKYFDFESFEKMGCVNKHWKRRVPRVVTLDHLDMMDSKFMDYHERFGSPTAWLNIYGECYGYLWSSLRSLCVNNQITNELTVKLSLYDCPNLKTLQVRNWDTGIGGSNSVETLELNIPDLAHLALTKYPNVKCLTIQTSNLDGVFFPSESSFVFAWEKMRCLLESEFNVSLHFLLHAPNLRHLDLTCHGFDMPNYGFPNVTHLRLNAKFTRFVLDVFPNLQTLDYTCDADVVQPLASRKHPLKHLVLRQFSGYTWVEHLDELVELEIRYALDLEVVGMAGIEIGVTKLTLGGTVRHLHCLHRVFPKLDSLTLVGHDGSDSTYLLNLPFSVNYID